MKLDRLLSIVTMLLNRNIIQAKELADRFEVSVRTIYRDIEAINQAGIPIVTFQGMNGGIGLAKGYRLDRNVLTNDELAAIITALRGMSNSYISQSNEQLVEKINSIISPARAAEFHLKSNHLIIDLTPWGSSGSLEFKLQLIKQAIEQQTRMRFNYSNANGELTFRIVEPYTLILKGRHWYLEAFCLKRGEFRLFKLLRIKDPILLEQVFTRDSMPIRENSVGEEWVSSQNSIEITLCFQKNRQHLAEEWFSIEEILIQEDRSILVRPIFPENEWLYGFILSLGPDVEVLEPLHLRQIIESRARKIANIYGSLEQT
ncbi:helix-turn-helix transcriptional regulator [Paenibacillus endoradicis]|uniref:helix-turn-helix transcriptional regulator n=1 Tax=Paenibacillus endoradicis TaxID=2972487 RepID=UPI002159893A|nr:YafY family protein [Paenibacillus endoradicis]MCR8659188.1 YafY family transcriptional regulator [Paenibacillus endoradicis]